MSEEELLKVQTCTLRVNIHCEGCKHKMKKILHKIDGVYITNFEGAELGKVTVSGEVEAETLIRKLKKHGKHAELISAHEAEEDNGDEKKGKGPKGGNNTNLPPPPPVLTPQFNVPTAVGGGARGIPMIGERAVHGMTPNRITMAPSGTQEVQISNFPAAHKIPTAHGHPATSVHVGGAGGGASMQVGYFQGARPGNPLQPQQMIMNQQRPVEANFNPPPPPPYDDNTTGCRVM